MSRFACMAGAAALAFAVACLGQAPPNSPQPSSEVAERAEREASKASLQARYSMSSGGPIAGIGTMALGGTVGAFGLTPTETEPILKLDQVARIALSRHRQAMITATDAPKAERERRHTELKRVIDAALRHGAALVSHGFLDESQRFCLQQNEYRRVGARALLRDDVAAYLALSQRQRRDLVDRLNGFMMAESAIPKMTVRDQVPGLGGLGDDGPPKGSAEKQAAEEAEQAVWSVLNPRQYAKWSQVLERESSPLPENRPVPAPQGAGRKRLAELEAEVDRVLAEPALPLWLVLRRPEVADKLKLDDARRHEVDEVDEVARAALARLLGKLAADIDKPEATRSRARARMEAERKQVIEHAEGFIRLGILTTEQAAALEKLRPQKK